MPKKTIVNYIPKNRQEETDKKAMIEFIKQADNSLSRNNLVAHFTTSAFIITKDFNKVLFAFHNIYNNWSWIGGHNDLDSNFLNVCLKEVNEETGLTNFYPFSEEPIMLDIIQVTNHFKNGKYIGDHLHLNLTYLIIASDLDELKIKADENSALRWFKIEEMVNVTNEERMKPIYSKAYKIINELRSK